jgi:hypothetical protein
MAYDFGYLRDVLVKGWCINVIKYLDNWYHTRTLNGLSWNFATRLQRQLAQDYRGKRLLCVCDFLAVPYSFDILVYLFVADKFRQERGLEKLDVAFICHESDPCFYNCSMLKPEYKEHARDYGYNLGIEATRLLPSAGNVLFFDNRNAFATFLARSKGDYQLFPEHFDPARPGLVPALGKPPQFVFKYLTEKAAAPDSVLDLKPPRLYVEKARDWIVSNVKPKIPVTITLRNYFFEAGKNSNLDAWRKVVAAYSDSEIACIVLPDFAAVYKPDQADIPGATVFTDPVMSLPLRAALYQEASLNLFVNNGPACLGYLSRDINYLMFNIAGQEESAYLKNLERNSGLRPGQDFFGAGKYQKLVWSPDSYEAIMAALEEMLDTLRRDGKLVPAYY